LLSGDVGGNVADAFLHMYFLETACQIQLAPQSGGSTLTHIDQSIIDDTTRTRAAATPGMFGGTPWPALLRRMDRKDPSFRE